MGRIGIYNGLIYGGGGAIVIPNPEGTPTDELHSIQIDDDIYEIISSSGASAIEKTQAEYDALTPEQKENGAIYMVQPGDGSETAFDMTNITSLIENTSVMGVTSTEDTTTTTYSGGSSIGLTFYYTTPIDVTNIDKIQYSLTTGSCYGGGTEAGSDVWNIRIGIRDTVPTTYIGYDSDFLICNSHKYANITYSEEQCILDVKDYSGYVYLAVSANGWNSTITDFILVTEPSGANKIYYMGTEYANTNGGSGDDSQELISYDTTITTTQYGWWEAEDKDGNTLDPDQYELVAVTPTVDNTTWTGAWDGAFYIQEVSGNKSYEVTFVNINDGGYIRTSRTWDVKVVYRDKNAAGGGSGSTVVPNPQEEPTDTLNTIEIDGVVYNIEGGSEGEGVEIYSTEEYIIGKWIDGKKLYQRTLSTTLSGSQGSIDVSSLNIDNGWIVDGYYDIGVTKLGLNEYMTSNSYTYTHMNDNLTPPYIDCKNTVSADSTVYVTIRYTKTTETDAPAWGGSVNNFGGFVDTSNIIDSGSYQNSLTYTATEDCFIYVGVVMGANNSASITIDGEVVTSGWCQSLNTMAPLLPLKKGQTLVATASTSNTSNYTVFGVSYSSSSSGGSSSVDYSTEEREIGTWVDGSKIYERTWEFSSPLSITAGGWGDTSIAVADTDIYIIIDCEAISSSGARWTFVSATTDLATTTYVRLLNIRGADVNVKYLTLRYTKTTT